MNNFEKLVDGYIKRVSRGLMNFKQLIGDAHPLSAWRGKIIPQKGKLSAEINYEFHGIGCLFIYSDCEVDFDFSPDIKLIGFDLWRLSKYADSFENNPYYRNKDALKEDFEEALDKNIISKSSEKYCRLYFLTNLPHPPQ